MSSTDLKRQYVEPGACVASLQNGNTVLTTCALEPRWCPKSSGIAGREGDTFLSSRQLHKLGVNTPGYSCLSSDGTDPRHYVLLGRCASSVDNFVCTSVADNCKNAAAFEPTAEMCTLLADLAPDREDERTLFTACYDGVSEGRNCYWSSSDCPIDEGYEAYGARPYSFFLECQCEDTQVGACKTNDLDEYFCATSAESCDNGSTFLTVQDLRDSAGIECRLCKEPTRIPDAIVTGTPARPSPSTESPSTTPFLMQEEMSESLTRASMWTIIGSVVGGLVLAALLTFVIQKLRCRGRRSHSKAGGTAIVVELAAENSRTNSEINSSACDASSSERTHSEVERAEYS